MFELCCICFFLWIIFCLFYKCCFEKVRFMRCMYFMLSVCDIFGLIDVNVLEFSLVL